MVVPGRGRAPLKAIMLAGIFLTCILQLVQAQDRFHVTKEPEHPEVGQQVTLTPRGIPGQITLCKWFRDSPLGPSGEILSFTQFSEQNKSSFDKNQQKSNGSAFTGREALQQDCSLRIQKLTTQDTGNYSVLIQTVAQAQQSGQASDVEDLEASIYLRIKAPTQRIDISADQQHPKVGQIVKLTPRGDFRQFTYCQWSIPTHTGSSKPIIHRIPGQVGHEDSAYRGRVTVGDDCSLQIRQLRTSDTNNYTVTIRGPSQHPVQPQNPQRPQQPGQRDHGEGEHEQEYTGHLQLNIAEPHTGPKGGSASLSYSTGVIAGGLLGSLAWADSLMSLFSVFLGSLASWRSKFFP